MEKETAKFYICGCPNNFRGNFAIYKSLFIIFLLFSFERAQSAITAQLSGEAKKEGDIEIPPKTIRKDDRYFWDQTIRQLNEQRLNREKDIPASPEYIEYVETDNYDYSDQFREGAYTDEGIPHEYYYYEEPEPENEVDERLSPPGYQTARLDEVKHHENGDYYAGFGQPCDGEKSCVRREESRQTMLYSIKRNILKQLKMKKPPNITVPEISLDSPPIQRVLKKHGMKKDPVLKEWELEYEDPEYEEDQTKTETVISYARKLPFPGKTGSYFKFNADDMQHNVTSAIIWFYMKPNPTTRTNVTVEFYRYQKNSTHPNEPPVAVKFDRKIINFKDRKAHWKMSSIASEVSRWFKNPESNLGIDIRCVEIPDILFSSLTPGHEEKKPILDVDLISPPNRRKKRDLGSLVCDENSKETRCCKYNFEIDFRSMGWNWIIAPKVYRSFFCEGDCPLLFMQSNQNKMLQMQNMRRKPTAACCAPTQMDAMSMLFFDDEERIIFSQVPEMVVKKCGCM